MLALYLIILWLIGSYFFIRRRYFWLLRKIPTYPNCLPVIGHAHLTLKIKSLINNLESVTKHANRCNGLMKCWLGPFPVIVITNPEDAEVVLNSCLNKGAVYKFSKEWVGQGLITSKASIWKRHIKKLSPAFNQRVLDSFLVYFNIHSIKLIDVLEEKVASEPFDIYPYIGAANLEAICQTAMGTPIDIQSQPDHPFLKAVETILHIITKRSASIWLHPEFIFKFTKYKKIQDEAIKILQEVSDTVINKKTELLENKFYNQDNPNQLLKTSFRAFLDLILEVNKKDPMFSYNEIREQVNTMIAAGQETTSYVILFTLLTLGSHPDVQEKVYQELKDVFGESNRFVEKEDITKLPYLEATLKETMRLYPVVPMIFRYIDKEIKLKNFLIPKGCSCGISIWGINRHERWGKDFEQFRPERWLDTNSMPEHPASFATFSYGRRICIGRHYAMMSMKTMLTHLLRRYRFTSNITALELDIHFVLKPISGNLISIEKR